MLLAKIAEAPLQLCKLICKLNMVDFVHLRYFPGTYFLISNDHFLSNHLADDLIKIETRFEISEPEYLQAAFGYP